MEAGEIATIEGQPSGRDEDARSKDRDETVREKGRAAVNIG